MRQPSCICKDCGMRTTPSIGKRVFRHIRCWEYYMFQNKLWAAAGMKKKGFLCIGCLEDRIGRRLTPRDFTVSPINDPDDLFKTPRLVSRLRKRAPGGKSPMK